MAENISKNQIRKLGKRIKTQNEPPFDNSILNDLQLYRTSYKDSLSQVFNILCVHSKNFRRDAIVTYRIKRIDSIIRKLDRHPNMMLDRMWDIAGCRCILKTNKQVQRLYETLQKEFNIKKTNDYRRSPQPDGYKSLHIYVNLPNDNNVIELQLRTVEQHNWATLVEISDLIYDAGLKEYGRDKRLFQFHLLLSKKDKLTQQDKIEVVSIIKEYDYFNNLRELFHRNYLKIRKQWVNVRNNPRNKFFLIEVNKDNFPNITAFNSFNLAEEKYFQLFKENSDSNIVLTHLTTPSYKQISIAYSNYILTFHQFIDDFYLLLESLIIDSIKNKNMMKFFDYYSLYIKTTENHIESILSEVHEYQYSQASKLVMSQNKNEKEWTIDILNQLEDRTKKTKKLEELLSKNMPDSKIYSYLILKFIHYKYNRSLKRVMKMKGANLINIK